MQIERLDHLVLTVRNIEASCVFYERVLGMRPVTFGAGRRALHFGQQKINLHEVGREGNPPGRAADTRLGGFVLCHRRADRRGRAALADLRRRDPRGTRDPHRSARRD